MSETTSSSILSTPTPAPAALMREWRWYYRRAEWAHLGTQPRGRIRQLRRVLGRPIRAALMAREYTRRSLAVTVAERGPSRVRQLVHIWWLRVWHGLEAPVYYRLRLYERDQWRRARGVVREREMQHVVRLLNAADPARGREMIGDKTRTEAWCAQHQLPTAATLVTVQDGRVVSGGPAALPDADLFSKLTRAYGGTGARRWTRIAPGQWVASDDGGGRAHAPVDRAGVIAAACEQSRETGQTVLLQRALANHPTAAALTNGALATVRFVTLRAVSGAVSVVSATYRMPTGAAVIDAFSHGGLAAPVELATGQLGPALDLRMAAAGTSTDTHPDTGARITKTTLPDWRIAVALVQRAHEAVPGMVPLIGWDVALTTDGPVLVEGNVPPSADLMQIPARTPLGETPIVAELLNYLRTLP